MKTMLHEQFTQIDLDEMDDIAIIETNMPSFIKKLDVLCLRDKNVIHVRETNTGYTQRYAVPKGYVRIQRPRTVSARQREEARQRMINYHKRRKGNL